MNSPIFADPVALARTWAQADQMARLLRKSEVERIVEQPLGISASVPRIFFVDSTRTDAASTNSGLEPDRPFATIMQAIGACESGRGDIIMLAPGHSETVIAAAGVTVNKTGVTVLGMGNGALRPTFNFTTAVGASFDITAAGFTLENCLFLGGIDALTGIINVQAADARLLNFETRDVTGQMTDCIVTTAAADRLRVSGWRHNGASAAGGAEAIKIVGGDGIVIEDFDIFGNFSVAAIQNVTTACTNLRIGGGRNQNFIQNGLDNAAVVAVTLVSTSTGHVGPNIHCRIGVDATSNTTNITEAFVGAAMQFYQPLNIANLGGEVAMQSNITAATDA